MQGVGAAVQWRQLGGGDMEVTRICLPLALGVDVPDGRPGCPFLRWMFNDEKHLVTSRQELQGSRCPAHPANQAAEAGKGASSRCGIAHRGHSSLALAWQERSTVNG